MAIIKNTVQGNGQKKGGEINGSKRAEKSRIQEGCKGRIPHISFKRI